MTLANPKRRLSEQDYLAIERESEFKSEFFDGEMFAMAGGSRKHSLIASNITRELGNQLSGRPCVVFNSDLRVKVEPTGLYTYPDASVVCGPVMSPPGSDDILLNPILVVEVLSDSTEAYDRGKKFGHYRRISSLLDYLLVSQREPHVELFSRTGHQWTFQEATDEASSIHLPGLQITLSLAAVYLKVSEITSAEQKPAAV
jgi:Uma2 family endonuclease